MDDSTRLIVSVETILKGLSKTVAGLDQVEKKLRTVANIKVGGQTTAAGLNKAVLAAEKLAVRTQEFANRQERARQVTERLAQAQERLAKAAATSKLGASVDAHVKEFRAREVAARKAAREVERINNETRRQAERNEKEQERAETRLANHKIREAQRAAKAQARALEQTLTAQRGAQGQGTGIFGAAAIGGIIGGTTVAILSGLSNALHQGAQAWIDYASKIQNARIAFSTMLGGLNDADQHLRALQKFALETPFAFDELVDASQRMQALGFSAEEVIPVLRDVGNAVAAAGGGSERLDRVIKALSDVRAKGKLQSQEIRQFAEAGISVFRILQEETGKTTNQLQSMVEAGEIDADFFLRAFQKFSQIHFGDLMEQQSKTFTGAMANVVDVLLQVSAKAFEPLFKKISQIAFTTQQELQKAANLDDVAQTLGAKFGELGAFLGTKLGEGIISALFHVNALDKAIEGFLEGSRQGVKNEIRDFFGEVVAGRRSGETSVFDLIQAETERVDKLKAATTATNENTQATERQAQAQKQAVEISEKAVSIYSELRKSISDVSSVSQFLAVKQELLRAGVTDLTSGYAGLALKLAAVSDAFNELQEREQAARARVAARNADFRQQLEQLSDSTRLALAELEKEPEGLSELERFNLTVGSQIEGVLASARAAGEWSDELDGLSQALKLTRKELEGLDTQIANKRAKEEADKVLATRKETIRSLVGLQRDINRSLEGREPTEIERIADQIQGLANLKIPIGALDPLIKLLQQTPTEIPAAIGKIQQLLSSVRGELGADFDRISQSIVNALSGAAKLDAQLKETAERRAHFEQLSTGLRIEQDRIQDRILDGTVSEREGRAEILALQREYKVELLKILDLELEQAKVRNDKTAVLNIEEQIDALQRLGKAIDEAGQQINQELFSDVEQGFEGIFEGARKGFEGLKQAAINFGESLLNTLNKVAAQGLTEKLFGGILKPDSENTAGTPGGFLSKLFGLAPKESPATVANTTATDANTEALNNLTTTFGGQAAGGPITDPKKDPLGFVKQIGGFVGSIFGGDKKESDSGEEDKAGGISGALGGIFGFLDSGLGSIAQQGSTVIEALNIVSDWLAKTVDALTANTEALGSQSSGDSLSGLAELFSGGEATGDIIPAAPHGRLIRVAEGGFDEAVLTTDPKHALRQAAILREYLSQAHRVRDYLQARPEDFAEGGIITARDAEANLLNTLSASRTPSLASSIPTGMLAPAAASAPSVSLRNINQISPREMGRNYLRSAEGTQDFLNIISENAPDIGRRIGLK
jgi:tape measure domain-containing protein